VFFNSLKSLVSVFRVHLTDFVESAENLDIGTLLLRMKCFDFQVSSFLSFLEGFYISLDRLLAFSRRVLVISTSFTLSATLFTSVMSFTYLTVISCRVVFAPALTSSRIIP
jgi:hypothetical protein